jgi:hypothetical protein
MTKVTLHYELARPLGEEDLDNIARLHSKYGMARVQLVPGQNQIAVDYDASRLLKDEVEAALTSHSIPIRVAVA